MPNGPQLKATDNCVVVGCPFTIDGQPSPCTHVQWVPTGGSLDLDCHSVGISIGANGVPQGPVITVPPPLTIELRKSLDELGLVA